MSFSSTYVPLPISSLQYRDLGDGANGEEHRDQGSRANGNRSADIEMSEAEFTARIRQERADAVAQVEQKLRQESEQKLLALRAPIATTLQEFAEQREDYFNRVEAEIIQLSLSIAAKILHREAQVDPMLVATLVRIAVEKMRDNSNIIVHVGAGRGNTWKRYFAGFPNLSHVQVAEDPKLSEQDCILETELGSANFGLDSQLKEVEQGFFDLLALRPANR
ncbi:MAG TPA: FliH/SctL family protein [Terracidiphilus sp.]|nr:FliH/SctL family protein [Terracidiphilus sp.]